jgi:murein DD-endopeptidase MepM/ murein hydrolase activator NlpD
MTFVEYHRPCKTKVTRDNFAAHVARNSFIPGLDYACNTGDDVYATADGKVIVADNVANDGGGISIVIKHRGGMTSHYLHLSKLLVKTNQRVKGGEKIALSGNTGTQTTGAHLHFALVAKNGKRIDPEKFFAKNRAELKALRREEKASAAATVTPETPVSDTTAQ